MSSYRFIDWDSFNGYYIREEHYSEDYGYGEYEPGFEAYDTLAEAQEAWTEEKKTFERNTYASVMQNQYWRRRWTRDHIDHVFELTLAKVQPDGEDEIIEHLETTASEILKEKEAAEDDE